MKSFLNWAGKAFLAACFAFLVMTGFCVLYDNTPVHYPNSSGATDYTWAPHFLYTELTEGAGLGRTNNEGLMNPYDYSDGMEIDILVMGSSHMEAKQVAQSESVAGRLSALLSGKHVYNIGVSGHGFTTCCANFEAALRRYRPSEYVIIETSGLDFSAESLNAVLNGTVDEIPDHSTGLVGFLSKNPFLRLVYHQLSGFTGGGRKILEDEDEDDVPVNDGEESAFDRTLMDRVLCSLRESAAAYGTKILIFYHPTTQIDREGELLLPDDGAARAAFSDLCAKNDIIFLDMTERFQREYDENHLLAHGFFNSSVGNGHLNKYGHEMIADEIYKLIG